MLDHDVLWREQNIEFERSSQNRQIENSGFENWETIFSQVEMYPNPSSGVLNLNSDNRFDYTIMDISGSIVLQGNDLIGTNSIAVSNLLSA